MPTIIRKNRAHSQLGDILLAILALPVVIVVYVTGKVVGAFTDNV